MNDWDRRRRDRGNIAFEYSKIPLDVRRAITKVEQRNITVDSYRVMGWWEPEDVDAVFTNQLPYHQSVVGAAFTARLQMMLTDKGQAKFYIPDAMALSYLDDASKYDALVAFVARLSLNGRGHEFPTVFRLLENDVDPELADSLLTGVSA